MDYPTSTLCLPPTPDGMFINDWLRQHGVDPLKIKRFEGKRVWVIEYFTGDVPPDPADVYKDGLPAVPRKARKALSEWSKHQRRLVEVMDKASALRDASDWPQNAGADYDSLTKLEIEHGRRAFRAAVHLVKLVGSLALARALMRSKNVP